MSDINEKDDYSHVIVGDDKVLPGPEGEDCSVSNVLHQTIIKVSTEETPEINGQFFETIQEIIGFLRLPELTRSNLYVPLWNSSKADI